MNSNYKNNMSKQDELVDAQWFTFQSLMKFEQKDAAKQYLEAVLKDQYGFLSEGESINLEDVSESTFSDANLHYEMQQREKERLKKEGESLLQEYCNDNNRDVTSSCAICDQSVLQCLCAFEMSPLENEKIKYEWAAKKGAPILSSFLVLADGNRKANLNYSIVGSCIHGKTDCCKLIYAEMKPTRKATEQKEAKSDVLELEFNIDAFLENSEDSEPYYIYYSEGKGVLHQSSEKSPLILGARALPSFAVEGFISSFKRAFSLACTSKVSNMPATLFDIVVQECNKEQYIPRNYVRTYLLPQYEVSFGLTFDFNGGIDFRKKVDFKKEYGQSYSQLGLSIIGNLTEKIFSDQTLEYTTEVNIRQIASDAKKHFASAGGFMSDFLKMLTILEKVAIPMKSFSSLPITVGFIFPIIKIEGSAILEYAIPPKEEDKTVPKLSSFNHAQNVINVKREKFKIDADPLLGGSLKLDILEMLASVLGAGAGKIIRKALDFQGTSIYFQAEANLIAELSGGGSLEIESSPINILPTLTLQSLRCNLKVGLDAKIEAGIRSFVFSAAFTAGFKVHAKFELGFHTNSKNGELGWYFGTNGAALYWTLIFSFGIGGDRDEDNSQEQSDSQNYGKTSLDASSIANEEKRSWEDALAIQSEAELRDTQKYLRDLETKKRSGLSTEFKYRDDDWSLTITEIMKKRWQVDNLIIGKRKLQKYIDELIMLTQKHEQQNGLSSADNSRRLELKVEVEKIYQDYGVPTIEEGNLSSKQEYDLLTQRKKELEQIIKENSQSIEDQRKYEDMVMGRTYKNPVAADVRKKRLDAEKELANISDGDYETAGKAVLMETSIITFDNLVEEDLKTIKQEMLARLK